MQSLISANAMNSRKTQPNAMSAHALRSFVLGIVDDLQEAAQPNKHWASREEGIAMIEEIMLEGRSCGFESGDGFRILCQAVLQFQIKLPFSNQVRQPLCRAGLTELQRVECLRLSLINNRHDGSISGLKPLSCN
jgi:hypothetical protein